VAAVQRRDSLDIRLKLLGEADVEKLRLELGVASDGGAFELTPV